MQTMKKKILFIVTEDWYFISHRLKLAKYLRKKDFEVFVCCRDTGKINDIKKQIVQRIKQNSLSNLEKQLRKNKSIKILDFKKVVQEIND